MTFRSAKYFAGRNARAAIYASTALTSLMLLAAPTTAQEVQLTTSDNGVTIQGTLVSFEGGVYTVDTIIGEIAVSGDNVICEGSGCPGVIDTAAVAPEPESNSVILTNPAGGVRLEGELLSFQNGIYTVETIIGEFDVFADGTVCEGPGCPELSDPQSAIASIPQPLEQIPTAPTPSLPDPDESALIRVSALEGDPDFTVAGPSSIVPHLLPALVESFAEQAGESVEDPGSELVSRQQAEDDGIPSGTIGLMLEAEDGGTTGILGHLTLSASEAYGMLSDGSADVAIVSVPAPLLSIDGRTETMLGTEGMVAVVSRDNIVTDISAAEMAGIFSGVITNWSEVGGSDTPIRLLGLPETHDVSTLLNTMVLGPLRLSAARPEVLFADAETLADAVDETPGAIAFLGAAAKGDARDLALSSQCGMPLAATAENIRTGRYPYSRGFFAVSAAAEDGRAADLLTYFDEQTPQIMEAAGLQPVTLDTFALTPDEDFLKAELPSVTDRLERLALSNALQNMGTADRLSVLLRTEAGGNRLNKSAADQLKRLIDHTEESGFRELFFVGHSPDTGDVGNNEALGLILAGAARDAILETDTEGRLDATVVRTVSMGALAPMACDTDDAADDMNRRVEVWVRK